MRCKQSRSLQTLIATCSTALAVGSAAAAPFPLPGTGDPAFPAFAPQPVPMPGRNPERSGLSTKLGALQPVWDHDLAAMVAPLAAAGTQLNFAFGQCFGGGMIDNLVSIGGGADLTATSASRWDEFAYYRRPIAIGGVDTDWVDTHIDAELPASPTIERIAYNAYRNDPWGVSPVAPRGNERRLETAQWGQVAAAAGTRTLDTKVDANRYAVLYSGQPQAEDWEQLELQFDVLTNVYNYDPANIFVVAAAGFASIPAGNLLRDPIAGIPAANGMPATVDDLDSLLTVTLGGLGMDDQLFFLANDHGVLQTGMMQPGCWIQAPKRPGDLPEPELPPELPPASPGGYSPPGQYLGSLTEIFDIQPDQQFWQVRPSWSQNYIPTPGTAVLLSVVPLTLHRRRRV